jgi:hypothetical protein
VLCPGVSVTPKKIAVGWHLPSLPNDILKSVVTQDCPIQSDFVLYSCITACIALSFPLSSIF